MKDFFKNRVKEAKKEADDKPKSTSRFSKSINPPKETADAASPAGIEQTDKKSNLFSRFKKPKDDHISHQTLDTSDTDELIEIQVSQQTNQDEVFGYKVDIVHAPQTEMSAIPPALPESHEFEEQGSAMPVDYAAYSDAPWYATSGRIGRIRFMAFGFIWGLVLTIIALIVILLLSSLGMDVLSVSAIAMLVVMIPAFLYAYVILPKRRLNDMGKSGWLALLVFVPIINFIYMLFLYLKSGDIGTNKYGAPPAPLTLVEKVLGALLILLILVNIGIAAFMFNTMMSASMQGIDTNQPAIIETSDNQASVVTEPEVETEVIAEDDANVIPAAEDTEQDGEEPASPAANGDEGSVVEGTVTETVSEVSYEEFLQEAESTIYVDHEANKAAREAAEAKQTQ